MKTLVAIAYIPVIHKGYIDFCTTLKERGCKSLYLIGDEILASHESLDYINRKDRLRALPVEDIQSLISDITDLEVTILTLENISELQNADAQIFAPREDITTFVVNTYFKDHELSYVDIFLRWNKENVGEEKVPESVVTIKANDLQSVVFRGVLAEADKSFDWWRQVGAALVKDEAVLIVTHNEHMPEEQLPNIIGDTRSLFKKGIHINYVTAAHAEVAAIGEAAKRGIATEGAELYVTDFPCPYCARLIAKSGIKKIYFQKGYAVLDGDVFLTEAGIELIKVTL